MEQRRESKNYGKKGGTLIWIKPDDQFALLARDFTVEHSTCNRFVKWQSVHVYLWMDMGIDAAEHHANWGV